MLNQNTFFSLSEITDNFETKSACHLIYGDGKYLKKYINIFISIDFLKYHINFYEYYKLMILKK